MTEALVPQQETEKRLAAEAAAGLVESGMTVGLGTGSTVAFLLPALAARNLDIVCVATSVATGTLARSLGLDVRPFGQGTSPGHRGGPDTTVSDVHAAVVDPETIIARLDMAIDGADQVGADFWLVKGGGGAHTREKIVAAAADQFVVIVSSDKLMNRVAGPVPLELMGFGLGATLRALRELGECRLRDAPKSPDGGVLVDYFGDVVDPWKLSATFASTPGIVDHGLFPPALVGRVLVGRAGPGAEAGVEALSAP